MLVIRKEQMIALENSMLQRLVERIAVDLYQALPRHCEALGPEGVRGSVRYGIKRAEFYGIEFAEGIQAYTRLMFMFGRDFDVDPALPWASKALTDPNSTDPTTRTNRLIEASKTYLQDLADINVARKIGNER